MPAVPAVVDDPERLPLAGDAFFSTKRSLADALVDGVPAVVPDVPAVVLWSARSRQPDTVMLG